METCIYYIVTNYTLVLTLVSSPSSFVSSYTCNSISASVDITFHVHYLCGHYLSCALSSHSECVTIIVMKYIEPFSLLLPLFASWMKDSFSSFICYCGVLWCDFLYWINLYNNRPQPSLYLSYCCPITVSGRQIRWKLVHYLTLTNWAREHIWNRLVLYEIT